MTKQASLLLNEHPLMVYPSLAKAMGINKAIIFQQLHFLMNLTKTAKTLNNFVDNRWWVYNSYPQWRKDYFPWLSIGAIKRLFLELERDGFITSRQGVKSKADRRKWYSIDYARWEQFVTTIGTICDHTPSAQNETMDGHKKRRWMVTKLANEVPETTTETTTEKKSAPNGAVTTVPEKDLSVAVQPETPPIPVPATPSPKRPVFDAWALRNFDYTDTNKVDPAHGSQIGAFERESKAAYKFQFDIVDDEDTARAVAAFCLDWRQLRNGKPFSNAATMRGHFSAFIQAKWRRVMQEPAPPEVELTPEQQQQNTDQLNGLVNILSNFGPMPVVKEDSHDAA